MAPKLAMALALAAFVCPGVAPAAAKPVGVGEQRLVVGAHHPGAAATTSVLIAPAASCPGQSSLDSPASQQEREMVCMTNFARAQAGLGELAEAPELGFSAHAKAEDVLRCDSFSHFACDREFTYWLREAGYIGEACWHAGENLAWGTGEDGSVRAIFRAWMSSPAHRRNILGDYEEVGIALLSGALEGHAGAQVWAAHFGSRCAG